MRHSMAAELVALGRLLAARFGGGFFCLLNGVLVVELQRLFGAKHLGLQVPARARSGRVSRAAGTKPCRPRVALPYRLPPFFLSVTSKRWLNCCRRTTPKQATPVSRVVCMRGPRAKLPHLEHVIPWRVRLQPQDLTSLLRPQKQVAGPGHKKLPVGRARRTSADIMDAGRVTPLVADLACCCACCCAAACAGVVPRAASRDTWGRGYHTRTC